MDDLDLGQTLRGFTPGQKVFERYTLTRMLGRGGMGVVWLARDGKLDREVALKFLPEMVAMDERAVDDLKRETRRALELTHPHIVRIYDFVDDSRLAAVSMEYVDGSSLTKLALEQPGKVFEVAQLRTWVGQLCEALQYAHGKAKIAHRDLKPANLMIDARGDLKVADFGISATLSDTTTRVSKQVGSSGTPVYMSPQQMMGEKPAATDDIYSLGATLYELLTGKPPFYSGNILLQVQNKVPPSVAERRAELGVESAEAIPAAWEETIAACLAKQPEDRPQSAAEVWGRLNGEEGRVKGESGRPDLASASGSAVGPDLGRGRAAASKLAPSKSEGAAKSKFPMALGLAAVVALGGTLGWYYGIEQSAQRRAEEQRVAEIARAEEQRRVEQQRQAELARLEAARAEAEQARKAAEERAAAVARERDEQARLAAEAAAKAERERQAAAAARAEQERLAAAQAAAEQARRAASERERATSVANTSGGSRGATSVAAGQSITIPGLNLELVPIAAGRFAMGSTNGGSDEQPVTQVEITRAFWLGKTEVTQGQWEAVMGNNPSIFKGATRPVEQVSYDDVVEFCRKLTARERAAGRLPSGYEYTLPTEAQWEYACRAGTTGDYSFGNNADELSRYGNYCDRSNTNDFDWKDKSHDDGQDKTAPVGSYRPNAWGLYDMHGNVWEWCLDWYTGTLPGGTVRDPVGPSSGTLRVVRGGSWHLTATFCRSADRSHFVPGFRHLGFRLALSSVP